MSRTRRTAIAFGVAVTIAAGCGVPTGPESFQPIDGADVPNRLNDTATTTTTTTTTTAPTTTSPDQQETTTTTTTTEPEIPTETRNVYFVSRGRLVPKQVQVLVPVAPTELIDLLEAGPSSDLLDNEIPLNLIESTSVDSGVMTIELNDVVFKRVDSRDQLDAIAQMVLTFLNNLTGVGQAVFTIEDERLIVPIGNGQSTEEPVALDDYANLLVDAEPDDPDEDEGDATSPTTTTTTTEP